MKVRRARIIAYIVIQNRRYGQTHAEQNVGLNNGKKANSNRCINFTSAHKSVCIGYSILHEQSIQRCNDIDRQC